MCIHTSEEKPEKKEKGFSEKNNNLSNIKLYKKCHVV